MSVLIRNAKSEPEPPGNGPGSYETTATATSNGFRPSILRSSSHKVNRSRPASVAEITTSSTLNQSGDIGTEKEKFPLLNPKKDLPTPTVKTARFSHAAHNIILLGKTREFLRPDREPEQRLSKSQNEISGSLGDLSLRSDLRVPSPSMKRYPGPPVSKAREVSIR